MQMKYAENLILRNDDKDEIDVNLRNIRIKIEELQNIQCSNSVPFHKNLYRIEKTHRSKRFNLKD